MDKLIVTIIFFVIIFTIIFIDAIFDKDEGEKKEDVNIDYKKKKWKW